ncbi:MAG TPA: sigma-70 family RNA polymerase sigma factor, partial [Polyangiales bacterium]|nr:sigma-70 family RNA polymerase sigma factor [Polyangiales bacterium]
MPAARPAGSMALHPPAADRGTAALDAQLAKLFEQHADFVHRALQRLGVPSADVDDSLQEVFLVVARRLDSYVERGAMRAWLFVIARQVALHVVRARRRRPPETPPPIAAGDPHL